MFKVKLLKRKESNRKMKIEKGIPAPKVSAKNGKYNFQDMAVGDSVLFKSEEYDLQPVRVRASQMKKEIGATFTCRKVDGGMRVWRIA